MVGFLFPPSLLLSRRTSAGPSVLVFGGEQGVLTFSRLPVSQHGRAFSGLLHQLKESTAKRKPGPRANAVPYVIEFFAQILPPAPFNRPNVTDLIAFRCAGAASLASEAVRWCWCALLLHTQHYHTHTIAHHHYTRRLGELCVFCVGWDSIQGCSSSSRITRATRTLVVSCSIPFPTSSWVVVGWTATSPNAGVLFLERKKDQREGKKDKCCPEICTPITA